MSEYDIVHFKNQAKNKLIISCLTAEFHPNYFFTFTGT